MFPYAKSRVFIELQMVFIKTSTHFRPQLDRSPNTLARTKIPAGKTSSSNPCRKPTSVGAPISVSGHPRYHKPGRQQEKRQRRFTDFGFRAPTLPQTRAQQEKQQRRCKNFGFRVPTLHKKGFFKKFQRK